MTQVTLQLNGETVQATSDMSLLEVIRTQGADVPTLCYYEGLDPQGLCRLCTVEVTMNGRSRLLTACNTLAQDGQEVETESPRVLTARKLLLEMLLARCSDSEPIRELAARYGVTESRFSPKGEPCAMCGLCVRVCQEVVGVGALAFTERGVEREVTIFPEITQELCISCGACARVCPSGLITLDEAEGRAIVHSEVRYGPNTGIRIPYMQSVPNVPFIDEDVCIHFETGECGVCQNVCTRDAIDFEQEPTYEEFEVGSIIVATGFQSFDPVQAPQWGYGRYDNVITAPEFECLVNASGYTGGKILLVNGEKPERIAIIHCVGSRDENFHEYCSRICCMTSLKYAHLAHEKTGAEVYNFYIDMRTFGKGYEEFYKRLRNEGVHFIRGRAAEVAQQDGHLLVKAEDTLLGRYREVPVDMVILNPAMEADSQADKVSQALGLQAGSDGFFMELHPKLEPMKTAMDGVFVAGACQGPRDIPDTVAHAGGAAAEALSLASAGSVVISPVTAYNIEEKCSGCRLCISVCPFSAITFDEEAGVARYNATLCKGCGTCVATCPSGAARIHHFEDVQILAQIEGVTSR